MDHLKHALLQPKGYGAQNDHQSFAQIGEAKKEKLHPRVVASHQVGGGKAVDS